MTCTKCGSEMEGPFCGACGHSDVGQSVGDPVSQNKAVTDTPAKPWYRRTWVIVTACVVALFIIIGAISSATKKADKSTSVTTTTQKATTTTTKPKTTTSKPKTTTPPTVPKTTVPPAPAGPVLTQQQKRAVQEAKSYLSTAAFSQQGLIDQLDSSYGSGYSVDDATIAVNSLTVDWNAQAVESAKAYLSTSPFSCSALIEQLSSSYGEKFTADQATYGAQQAGAC